MLGFTLQAHAQAMSGTALSGPSSQQTGKPATYVQGGNINYANTGTSVSTVYFGGSVSINGSPVGSSSTAVSGVTFSKSDPGNSYNGSNVVSVGPGVTVTGTSTTTSTVTQSQAGNTTVTGTQTAGSSSGASDLGSVIASILTIFFG